MKEELKKFLTILSFLVMGMVLGIVATLVAMDVNINLNRYEPSINSFDSFCGQIELTDYTFNCEKKTFNIYGNLTVYSVQCEPSAGMCLLSGYADMNNLPSVHDVYFCDSGNSYDEAAQFCVDGLPDWTRGIKMNIN